MRASWVDEGAPFPCQNHKVGGRGAACFMAFAATLPGETSDAHCVVSVDHLVLTVCCHRHVHTRKHTLDQSHLVDSHKCQFRKSREQSS